MKQQAFRHEMPKSFLCASLLLVPLTASTQEASTSSEPRPASKDTWALEVQPLAERFSRLGDVRLVLTVRNVGDAPRSISLPFREEAEWPNWIRVLRDGVQLDGGDDPDFAAEPAELEPGEQLSVLVSLSKFLSEEALRAGGSGTYELAWDGGTIGFASSAAAAFTVTEQPLGGPAPGSLASFLPRARPGEPELTRIQSVWSRIVSEPSDPRWLAFLAAVPPEGVDVHAAFDVLESTKDRGIQRAIVQLLGRIGRDAAIAERLLAFLVGSSTDASLSNLGAESLRALRGD